MPKVTVGMVVRVLYPHYTGEYSELGGGVVVHVDDSGRRSVVILSQPLALKPSCPARNHHLKHCIFRHKDEGGGYAFFDEFGEPHHIEVARVLLLTFRE